VPSHICHQQGGVPSVNKVPSGANFTRAHLLRARVGSSAARGPGQGARRISPHRTHGGLGHGAIARACTSAGLALALGSRPAGSGASASMRPMNTCAPRAHACGPADGTQLLLSARPASAAVAHPALARRRLRQQHTGSGRTRSIASPAQRERRCAATVLRPYRAHSQPAGRARTGQSAPKALLMVSPSVMLPARATLAATNDFSAATLAPSTRVSAQLIAGPPARRLGLWCGRVRMHDGGRRIASARGRERSPGAAVSARRSLPAVSTRGLCMPRREGPCVLARCVEPQKHRTAWPRRVPRGQAERRGGPLAHTGMPSAGCRETNGRPRAHRRRRWRPSPSSACPRCPSGPCSLAGRAPHCTSTPPSAPVLGS